MSSESVPEKEMVWVPKEEYEALLRLRTDLPLIISQAKDNVKKERLSALNKKFRENPEKKRKSDRIWYQENKEQVKAKARERYQKKKAEREAAAAAATAEIAAVTTMAGSGEPAVVTSSE